MYFRHFHEMFSLLQLYPTALQLAWIRVKTLSQQRNGYQRIYRSHLRAPGLFSLTDETRAPNRTFDFLVGKSRVPARRVSMLELGTADRVHSEKADDGSHSLPDCWSAQRMRFNSFACSAQMPSLSTALITSSSESSEDMDEEEERA